MSSRRSNADRSATTRSALVTAARRLFEERGYAATATADIVQAAGVTRGALYHHFLDKEDLLRAVAIEIQEELKERVIQAALAKEPDAWAVFTAGWVAFLGVADQPGVRVLMVDAPAVMGLEAWREIDDVYCLNAVIAGLRDLIEHKVIPDQPVEPLARVLLTGRNALATHIAGSADPAAERDRLIPVWLRQLAWIREAVHTDYRNDRLQMEVWRQHDDIGGPDLLRSAAQPRSVMHKRDYVKADGRRATAYRWTNAIAR